MKSIVNFFSFILITLQSVGQVNLVPNPSFEDYTQCPTGFDQIDRAIGWSSYAASPDYFNSCANSSGAVGVPSNTWGYQYAKDGNGYALVLTYDIQSLPFNYREYIGIELAQPLLIGLKYFVSAYISKGDSNYTNGATNNFGFRFTENQYSKFNPFIPDNFSHVKCDSIIFEQNNWVQIFGTLIPDTSFSYLMIGNFYDNQHTDTSSFNGFSSGYYIDAVCVSTDSIYSRSWTSISEKAKNNIQIVSIKDQIEFLNITKAESFSVYNLMGKEVYKGEVTNTNTKFDFSMLVQSMYLIKIKDSFPLKVLIYH